MAAREKLERKLLITQAERKKDPTATTGKRGEKKELF